MTDDELIARAMATHRDGNHLYGPDPLCVEMATRIQQLAAENARLRTIVGLHINADAYRDTFPDDDEDAKQLRESETWHRLQARSLLTDQDESNCEEAAKNWLRERPEFQASIEAARKAMEREPGAG